MEYGGARGFTLLEILIVATLIAILAGGGLVFYRSVGQSTRDGTRRADVEAIRGAIELYRSNNNAYPTSLSWGGQLCDPGGCSSGKYMEKVPQDPKSPSVYYYTGSASDYTLGADLEAGGTTCVAGQCGSDCNYCFGPYGQK